MTENGARASAQTLSRQDGIPSTPVAFLDFNSFSALRTSDTVIFHKLNFSEHSNWGSHLKNCPFEWYANLRSSAQETKK